MHFEVSFVVWLLIGALGVLIADEFRLTATQKGFLVAVPLLSGALLRVPVGWWSDCYGAKLTGLAILVCELIALLWGGLGATTYRELLGVGLLLGVAGASFAVALPLASRVYPPAHQGLVMGLVASGNSGTVLAAFFAPRLGQVIGWHGVMGLMVVPVLVTTVLFALLVRRLGAVPGQVGWVRRTWPSGGAGRLAETLRRPSIYWLCFVYAVTFGGFVGFASFLPIFFHDQYGMDLVTAGSMTALCGLAGSLIRPFGGYVADRQGGLRVLGVLLPVVATLTIAVGGLPEAVWAVPLMVLAVAMMGFGNGVVFQVVADRFQPEIGVASGLIGAAGGFGGFLLPSWLGLLKDLTDTYRSGFLVFAACSLIAWATVVVVAWRARRIPTQTVHEVDAGGFSH
jgi:NNP family nitrate/nitrite transporter-like MFS transporter